MPSLPDHPPIRDREVVIRVRDLVVELGNKIILDHLNLEVYRGEILGAPQVRASRCSLALSLGCYRSVSAPSKYLVRTSMNCRQLPDGHWNGDGVSCSSMERCFRL